MSLVDRIDSLLPRWMLTAPRQHVGKLMASLAGMIDALALQVFEGRLAALPGQVRVPGIEGLGGFDSCDALPMIGRDRSRRGGLDFAVDPPWAYAERLRAWMDDWSMAATPWGLLRELMAVLRPPGSTNPADPFLRLVTAGGDWWTITVGGAIIFQNATEGWSYDPTAGTLTGTLTATNGWNWDSTTLPPPPDQNDPSRFWIIVYAPCTGPYVTGDDRTTLDLGVSGDLWNAPGTPAAPFSPDMGIAGAAAPRKWMDLLRVTIVDWKAAGCACSHAILTFDPTSFSPTNDSTPTSVPDGSWGYSTKYDATAKAFVASRFVNAVYIQGAPDA